MIKKFIHKHFKDHKKKVIFIGQFHKSGLHKHSNAHKQKEIDFISEVLFQPKKYLEDVEIIEKVHSYIYGKAYYTNCYVSLVDDTIVIQKGWE